MMNDLLIHNLEEVRTPLTDLHARLVECDLVKGRYEVFIVQIKCDIHLLNNEVLLQVSSASENKEISVIESCFNMLEQLEMVYQKVEVDSFNMMASMVVHMPSWKVEVIGGDIFRNGST